MLTLGSIRATAVLDGWFGLDGGELLRGVPAPRWRPCFDADADNRVRLALRCLLLQVDHRLVLVDPGPGDRWGPEQRARYSLARPEGDVLDALQRIGVDAAQVTDVILTHLHDDHAGGVVRSTDGGLEPSFPRATHHVQRRQWSWARHASELDRELFRPPELEALARCAKLHLLDGDTELFDGIEVLVSEGHCVGQQLVRVRGGDRTLLCCGDTVPTTAHLEPAWVSGRDLYPLTTLEEKKAILAQAVEEGWILFFSHDPTIAACHLTELDGRVTLGTAVDLSAAAVTR